MDDLDKDILIAALLNTAKWIFYILVVLGTGLLTLILITKLFK